LESVRTTSISIIIPITNEEKRVESCIQKMLCFCKEREWDFDLIFAEDGSTDNSASIVNRYITYDDRIKMVNTPTRQGSHNICSFKFSHKGVRCLYGC